MGLRQLYAQDLRLSQSRRQTTSQCATRLLPGETHSQQVSFPGTFLSGHACRISRAHTWAPPSVSIDVSLASVHSLRVILTWPSTEPLPRVSAVPPALARAVGDAVPSARQCPRPWLALSVTLSRARAAGLHPSFQPRSNRSPPCGRCRVAASTVLRSFGPAHVTLEGRPMRRGGDFGGHSRRSWTLT